MIRTTREAPYFGLWRDAATLEALALPEYLTTARYEPISRNSLGTGHVDLLFEKKEKSCVLGAIRLSPASLVTRERPVFIWPVHLATLLAEEQLLEIERAVTPWLRSLARARPMAQEAIRRFVPSQRFDRARAAALYGAAPLERLIPRMAPFIYARRFAAESRVLIDCADDALADAVLGDLAESVVCTERVSTADANGDRAFARAWYGVPSRDVWTADRGNVTVADPDVAVVDPGGPTDRAPIVIETGLSPNACGVAIDVPSPAPWDQLFSFDAADAPVVSRFSVNASEPALRACAPLGHRNVCGDSAGRIVLAVSPEALAMRGTDIDEVETIQRLLTQEGFSVSILADVRDPQMADAQLVHIFGAAYESHTITFAEAARGRGVAFLFDVAPRPQSPSAFVENALVMAFRAASDDTEMAHYLTAYQDNRLDGTPAPEPTAEEYAWAETRFSELARDAIAVLACEEDIAGLRSRLDPRIADRVLARGVFAEPEPDPAPIGHLVPSAPFAFIHASMSARSNALFATFAADSQDIPLVIAGPFYDFEYLQTLRRVAPSAIALVDPDSGVVSAIYRRATIWIDCAPRPRSAAALLRAVACGALPVHAAESPLSSIAGSGSLTFPLTSFAECGATLVDAMALTDREERIAALQERLGPRRDPARAFGSLIAAYACSATTTA